MQIPLGWDGICIEPNPSYHAGYKNRRCKLVGEVAGSPARNISFVMAGSGGGVVGAQFKNKKAGKTSEVVTMCTVPLVDILRKYNAPRVIDYLSLDVEGAESTVLDATFPFDEYRFLTMTIEQPKRDLTARLKAAGYH